MAQSGNKNIDNASGQVVRLDIQNTLKTVATHNYGQRNSAGTIEPCEFLADSTTNKLLIRKQDGGDQANPNPTTGTAATFYEVGNLDEDHLGLISKAGGTMEGPLLADDGADKTAPAIAFDNDPDTGIFRANPDTIGFSTGGIERGIIASTGLTISDNKEIRLNEAITNGFNYVGLKAKPALANNVSLTLPDSIVSGGFLRTNGNGELSFATVAGVPTGAVFCMPGLLAGGQTGYQSNGIPDGYLECNGASLSRNSFAALFNVIGTIYGSQSATTFNLPNLRGEFIRGANTTNSGVDANRAVGSSQTEDNRVHAHSAVTGSTFTPSAAHNHGLKITHTSTQVTAFGNQHDARMCLIDITGGPVRGFTETAQPSGTVASTTLIGQDGSESRPRNIAMMYIIKI